VRDGADALRNPGRHQQEVAAITAAATPAVQILTVDAPLSKWITAGAFTAIREHTTDSSESGRFRHYG